MSCGAGSSNAPVDDHNKWKFALKDRSEMKPSIMAQNLRRAKGFVWDHVAGDFVPAASVPVEPVSSAIPRFDREKLHARDDTGCCWFAPPRKRDPRDFRCGGGNYFHAAKVGTRLFKVGQYVLFQDDDSVDETEETDSAVGGTSVVGIEHNNEGGPRGGSRSASPVMAVGRITCLWEGFPQSATISRWVEIRRLRSLSEFDDEAVNILKSTKPPTGNRSDSRAIIEKNANAKKNALVYTSEFDTFPLTCLNERVGVEFPLAPPFAGATAASMRFKKRAPAAAFECRAIYDEEEDRLSWLVQVCHSYHGFVFWPVRVSLALISCFILFQEPSNSASPQFHLATAGDKSDDAQDHVRWEQLFTYDIRESNSGKLHTNTSYSQLVRNIGSGPFGMRGFLDFFCHFPLLILQPFTAPRHCLSGGSKCKLDPFQYCRAGDQDAIKARYLPFHEDEAVSFRSSNSGQLVKGRVQRVRVLRSLKSHKSVAQWMFQV